MITFTPTEEQQMLLDAVRRYADNDLRKIAHEADETSAVPDDAIAKGWELGILPGLIPETYGGYADSQPAVTGVLALEQMAWGDLPIALNVWTPSLFALPILICGTEEQKQAFLPAFCDSSRPIMTSALLEPSVAFDPWRPRATASRNNGKFVLNGEKTFVPLAAESERVIVFATDSETGRVDGYILEKGTPGLQICERNQLQGIRALPTYRIQLSGATVGVEDRLGGESGTDFPAIINRSRVALGAMAVGVARAAYEYALNYSKERVQFGVPIATKQSIAFMLADMAIEVDAVRLLVWETAWQADQGVDITAAAAQVKLYASKMALFVTDRGVQILGGHGYIREHPVERWLRNGRGFAAFEALAMV